MHTSGGDEELSPDLPKKGAAPKVHPRILLLVDRPLVCDYLSPEKLKRDGASLDLLFLPPMSFHSCSVFGVYFHSWFLFLGY